MVSFWEWKGQFFTKDFNESYGIDSGGNGGGIFFIGKKYLKTFIY